MVKSISVTLTTVLALLGAGCSSGSGSGTSTNGTNGTSGSVTSGTGTSGTGTTGTTGTSGTGTGGTGQQLLVGVLATGTAGVPVSAEVLAHPDVGGFLVHQGWKDIETGKGAFDWTHLDSEFASAVANNKKIRPALHIGGDDAPKWLYDDKTIPFVLGKSGATFTHADGLTFIGNTVSIATATWPGDLRPGKVIEIVGTAHNDGRYRLSSDTPTSLTVEELFVDEVNVGGTISLDVVPCYWNSAVIQHKSDFYNALIAHIQSLGQAAGDAMLTLGIQMVGPNTGDWSFRDSPEQVASYNAAGWLTGNDVQKQAGLDAFVAAMKSMYDSVVPNVPATMLVGSAVGTVPAALLPAGADKNQATQDILAHVEANYPGKLLVAKGALNARTYFANPCPATGTSWADICANPNFLQINWSVSALNSYEANGKHEWDKSNVKATATILKNAGLSAHTYQALWFEIWHADVDAGTVKSDPALQRELDVVIAYVKDLFLNGNGVVGAPISVQSPPATIDAPVGTAYVLQYVFDYNGEVPDLFEVRKDNVVVGNDLSYRIASPTANDSGLYEISCRNSAGTTTVSTFITFR